MSKSFGDDVACAPYFVKESFPYKMLGRRGEPGSSSHTPSTEEYIAKKSRTKKEREREKITKRKERKRKKYARTAEREEESSVVG